MKQGKVSKREIGFELEIQLGRTSKHNIVNYMWLIRFQWGLYNWDGTYSIVFGKSVITFVTSNFLSAV